MLGNRTSPFVAWAHYVTLRLLDHRVWIVGLGGLSFLLTIVLFMGVPLTFQPTINTDYSTVKIEMTPGHDAAADRGGDRPDARSAGPGARSRDRLQQYPGRQREHLSDAQERTGR